MTAYRKGMAVRKPEESSYSYYECVRAHDKCPTCEAPAKPNGWTGAIKKRCYPEKRIRLGGWLWWRRECPLGGVHDHYKCERCNTVWVCFHTGQEPSKKIVV